MSGDVPITRTLDQPGRAVMDNDLTAFAGQSGRKLKDGVHPAVTGS